MNIYIVLGSGNSGAGAIHDYLSRADTCILEKLFIKIIENMVTFSNFIIQSNVLTFCHCKKKHARAYIRCNSMTP